jgi:exopolysaccharide biosynthesis polyprenyl glycosylphosphotransferase
VAGMRGYDRRHLGAGPQEMQALIRAGILVAILLSIVSYATRTEVPRRLVVVALPLVVIVSALVHYVGRRRLQRLRRQGRALLRTLLVGEGFPVRHMAHVLQRSPSDGHDVVGTCGPASGPEAPGEPAVLGAVAEIPQVVVDHDVDVVIVAGGYLSGEGLRRLSWALERTGAELIVEPGLVEVFAPRLSMRPTAGLSLLHVDSVAARRGQAFGKRTLDVVLGGLLLLVAVPVIAVSAVLVKSMDRGPAFFKQARVGLDGQRFTMYKLRTMVVDAEARRMELKHLSHRDGLMFKMRKDPRLIRGGAFLRRFSLDELPQLLNVVKGDMSLVGPRPPLVEEHDRYHDRVYRRLRVRPGLTGLWQVSGRSDLAWDDAIRLDLRYVDNWSVTMDLFILWKTARAILGGSGAY